jgi:Uma2 family endonuclease
MEARPMSQTATLEPEAIAIPEVEVGKLYEVVNGQIVEKPPMGSFQERVESILDQRLGYHAHTNGLGRVGSETLFKINPSGKLKRRPDVAFVSYERWARDRKIGTEAGWDVIPELAIEVISPSNLAEEVMTKIREYFQAGVLRVWVVYPVERLVYIYQSPRKNIILGEGDDLDGGDLLPGFRLSLAELFEDGAEE